MRLLLGCIPSREFKILNSKDRKKFYEEDFINRILSDADIKEENLKKSVINLFAYLIDKKILDVRLGFIVNNDGELASEKEINIALQNGMLHDKIGIFTDINNNIIAFNGSLNETQTAYLEHFDSITTYKSWKLYPGEKKNEYIYSIVEYFNKLWEGENENLRVFRLPDKSLSRISKLAPKTFPEEDYKIINEFYRKTEKVPQKSSSINEIVEKALNPFSEIKWFDPQINGYDNWKKNGNKGILAIATGVGKTLIALRISYEFLTENNEYKKLITIIVPDNLALQWKEEIEKYVLNEVFNTDTHFHLLISKKKGFNIKSRLILLKKALILYDKNIIVAYYNTFAKRIIPIINDLSLKPKILLIADEVHEIGTKKRRENFAKFDPEYRLGLSATPIRKFDIEGNEFIETYFSGTVFEYPIDRAIKENYLTPYNYFPLFYDLTEEELDEYNNFTRNIYTIKSKIKNISDPVKKKEFKKKLDNAKILRKRIIKLAVNKLPILKELLINLKNNEKIYHSLIYVEDYQQLEPVIKILEDLDIRFEYIIQDVNHIERMDAIKRFEEKKIHMIVAEKIFDQGINIEALKTGIILSSTVNERQYIQRRGRLLRKHFGKKVANIYDFITLDKSIKGEIKRAAIFYESCLNKSDVENEFLRKSIKISRSENNE